MQFITINSNWWIQVAKGYLPGLKHHLQKRNGIRVFCYHGIVEHKKDKIVENIFRSISEFQDQLRFLRFFRILSMTELMDKLINQTNQKQNYYLKPAVVITFDDGYANVLIAAEILDKYRIPWTLFISTGGIGQDRPLWPEELALLLLHGNAYRVEAISKIWSLKTREEREIALQEIRHAMKKLPAPQRRKVMEEIRQQFPEGETQRLLEQFPSLRMLTWKEVQQLASAGVEIGSHGVEHEIHHSNQPEFVRRDELVRSKEEIERQLNRPCHYFAYPNGDFTEFSSKEVQDAGYLMAFTMQERTISSNEDSYLLPRLSTSGSLSTFIRRFFWELK